MERSRFNEEQIIGILKEQEAAVGNDRLVCKMRDTGEVLDVRGGTRL